MKIHDVLQGTPEWTQLRAGIPTASGFSQIITPKTGKASTSQEGYMFGLLAERIMQRPLTEYMSFWMERGSAMEAEAVAFFEFQRDVEVQTVGFVTNDAETIGASPDRLVGDDGLLEIKCPSESIQISYLLQSGGAYEAYRPQVQGQLWVCERQWCDLLAYHPELPPALIRIERDEPYIEKLAAEVTAFSDKLEHYYAIAVERGWIAEPKVRQESLMDALRKSLIEINRQREQSAL